VAAPVGGTVLDGFIDLLFEEDGGLVVVDYKTDTLETEEEIAERVRHHRLQAGAYALTVQAATRRTVKEVVFLFLQPKGEASVPDLPAAIAEAEAAALTGA
jgi:ATP-dependent exoDNAse (exonuclease V) beta subunit